MKSVPSRWLAAGAGLLGLIFVVDALWVTDREAIAAECDAIGAAMVAQDIPAAMAHFHDDFAWEGLTLDTFGVALGMVAKAFPPTRARPDELETTVTGDRAVSKAEWAVAGKVQDRSIPGTLKLVMGWERTADGWRCTTLSADGSTPMLEMFGGNRMPITPATLRQRAFGR